MFVEKFLDAMATLLFPKGRGDEACGAFTALVFEAAFIKSGERAADSAGMRNTA
jgi:hypothetical protein